MKKIWIRNILALVSLIGIFSIGTLLSVSNQNYISPVEMESNIEINDLNTNYEESNQDYLYLGMEGSNLDLINYSSENTYQLFNDEVLSEEDGGSDEKDVNGLLIGFGVVIILILLAIIVLLGIWYYREKVKVDKQKQLRNQYSGK